MKRRDFLKLSTQVAAVAVAAPVVAKTVPKFEHVEVGYSSKARPATVDELYTSINQICEFDGWSDKAYEEIALVDPLRDVKRYTHKVYAVGIKEPNGNSEQKLISYLWDQIQAVVRYNDAEKPVVWWRKFPETYEYDNKMVLSMRLAIGHNGTDGNFIPFTHKLEGQESVYI